MSTTEEMAPRVVTKPGTEIEHPGQLWLLRFNTTGKRLWASGYDGKLHRWRETESDWEAEPPLAGHNGWVQSFAIAGDRLVSADSWGRLVCWQDGDEPSVLWQHAEAHPGWIRAAAISPDAKIIATAGDEPTVRLWSLADGKPLGSLGPHADRVFSLAFHPDEKSLAVGDLLGTIRHWDFVQQTLVREFSVGDLAKLDRIQQCGGARVLAFDASGERLACGGQKTPGGGFATGLPCVMVLDWQSGEVIHELQHGTKDDGFIYDVAFHPDGFVMATSSAFPGKGHLWFWQPGEEKPFHIGKKLTNGHALALRPGRPQLAFLVDVARNGNGRQLINGEYPGGTAKIHLLELGTE